MAKPKSMKDAPFARSIGAELKAAGSRSEAISASDKKNYAERLSRALSARVANQLRRDFPAILPDADGKGQESRARSSKGYKKLDVNYSTPELGLGLGVSIKTINFADGKTKRYTKNYTRADGELRAEASDYHERQPYAVMAALIFLPADSCDDGDPKGRAPSSFGQAVTIFRFRAGRQKPLDPSLLFERVFIGLYEIEESRFGDIEFFDVMDAPPKRGRPAKTLTFDQVVDQIVQTYDERNNPQFQWADAAPEPVVIPTEPSDDEED
jgi:hypothetical protein